MNNLPIQIAHVGVPPIKCQGIKTKLVPFIFRSIKWQWENDAKWIEPFLGSGVIAMNLAPQNALLIDTNKHIIEFYKAIQNGTLNRTCVEAYLLNEGKKLKKLGAEYYYEVRKRFNENSSPFDFLFLNRSCFNGVMRFNSKGQFNVPFCHKPDRFSRSYITKIINQISWAMKQMQWKNWEFRVATWGEALNCASPDDFVYLDPPYIGRHTDYYNTWDTPEACHLSQRVQELPCGYALSMWLENKYRRNDHIDQRWQGAELRVYEHFYHVGSTENLRNAMTEALLIKPGFRADDDDSCDDQQNPRYSQLTFVMEKRLVYKP